MSLIKSMFLSVLEDITIKILSDSILQSSASQISFSVLYKCTSMVYHSVLKIASSSSQIEYAAVHAFTITNLLYPAWYYYIALSQLLRIFLILTLTSKW